MNLYLVSQDANQNYDTYDAFVCVAESEDAARMMRPGCEPEDYGRYWRWSEKGRLERCIAGVWGRSDRCWDWVDDLSLVTVVCIGSALPGDTIARIVLDSYNAG